MPGSRVRWECPTGEHPGQLGPQRPRRENMVRYCVPCSIKTGKLTERVAPAVEKRRAEGKASSAERAKRKRVRTAMAKQRAAAAETKRYTVEGVDLRDELARYVKLRAFGGRDGRMAKRPPSFTVSIRSSYPRARLGFAEPWRHRIHVAIYPGMSINEARSTMLHELVHILVRDEMVSGRRCVHGPEFARKLRAARAEAGLSNEGWATAAASHL